MAIHTYKGIATDMKATLIDGYLPDRNFMLKSAEEVARVITNLPNNKRYSLKKRPYSWNGWEKDDLFEYIAFNTRGQYCMNKPKDYVGYVRSEAWLIEPENWEDGYILKNPKKDQSDRRLLVTLYQGCSCGDQCLINIVKSTGLKTIADREYKSIRAFKKDAERLLDDISLPFRAPCLAAEEKMTEQRYNFRTFGK